MGLLLLAVVAGAGLFWRTCRAADAPDAPAVPGNAAPELVDATAPTRPATANAAATADPVAQPTRVRVAGPFASAQQRCVVDVRVVREEDGSAPGATPLSGTPLSGTPLSDIPLCDVEVAIRLQDEPDLVATSRTDRSGRAQFEFVGSDIAGEVVIAAAGTGGETSAVLSPDAPVAMTLRVPTRAIVRGRVVDGTGVGVPGADLVLLRWATDEDTPQRRWLVGQSGPNGTFEVRLAVGGRLGAMRAGMVASALRLVRPSRGDGPPPTATFELMLLALPAALTGTVVGDDGRPVAQASLEFRSLLPPPSGAELRSPPESATSGSDGAFAVRDLPPGPIAWSARASGHGWASGQVELLAGVAEPLVVRLPPSCCVRGVVVTPGGAPIAGARVVAGTPGTFCSAATATAADGTFALDDLGPGPTRMLARATRAESGPAAEDRTELHLDPRQPAEWRAVLATAPGDLQLRGVVTDEGQRPLTGYRVIVRQDDREVRQVVTAADGTFALAVDAPRGLDVRAYAPGRPWTSFADAIRRDVDASAGELHLFVGRTGTGHVRGRVATNGLGAPAQIGGWHQERREYARYTADADGSFDIEVPVGTVDLTFDHPGHATGMRRGVRVARDQTVDLEPIDLALAGGMFGAVRGPGGVPPAQCELAILPRPGVPDDRRIVAEFSGGNYRFAAVPPGQHTLQVQAQGCAATTFDVTIAAGVDLLQDVELRPGLRRRVVVTVPAGGGDRVTLAVRPSGAPLRWVSTAPVARPAPGRDGTAEFITYMAAGSYEVLAGTRGGYEARDSVSYDFDDQPAVLLRLERR